MSWCVCIVDCGRELIHVLIRPVPICSHSHSGYIHTGPTYRPSFLFLMKFQIKFLLVLCPFTFVFIGKQKTNRSTEKKKKGEMAPATYTAPCIHISWDRSNEIFRKKGGYIERERWRQKNKKVRVIWMCPTKTNRQQFGGRHSQVCAPTAPPLPFKKKKKNNVLMQ